MSTNWTADWRRRAKGHPRVADGLVATMLFGFSVLGGLVSGPDVAWWTVLVPAGVASAALLWRRSNPRAVLVVTAACTVAESALGHLLTPLLMGPLMLALYAYATIARRATTWWYAFAISALLLITASVPDSAHHPVVLRTINPPAWIMLSALLGRGVQTRRTFIAAEIAHVERAREEETRHRVAEERMRIARELHDVVAHHLALANAQAGTAAHLARSNPDAMRDILDELAGTTAAALRELKATVGLLRQPDDPDAPLEPAPGIDRIPGLAASFAGVGLAVEVASEGTPRPISPAVEVTAYRIVQEALTNVAKHAGVSRADVRLVYEPGLLTVVIADEGRAGGTSPAVVHDSAPATRPAHTSPPTTGFGLIGMRERAQSVAGRLTAGPRPSGGFQVTAELPLDPD
ncbi:sensor histidine kinase [Yinghuangia aomiensis]|uniref:histidine kinase n=1 Tax=Yinghuangia aomiensis TaxID=676205 RepID=A0ABP9HXN1_9ACTN